LKINDDKGQLNPYYIKSTFKNWN